MTVTALASAAEVLVATGHDAFARSVLRRLLVRGWVGEGASAWIAVDRQERIPYLSALGAPGDVARLLTELLPELPPRQRVTVPRGTPVHLPAWVGVDGTDWDFRWLGAPPPAQPGEDRVQTLDDEPAVKALLTASSPTASSYPGDPSVRRWVGVHDADGSLVACAADTSGGGGVGHMSSIAVHPSARGQGLGTAVTAALTRWLFDEGNDVVTLGMYADNAAGRALYDRLGYADDHPFTSGPLVVRGRW